MLKGIMGATVFYQQSPVTVRNTTPPLTPASCCTSWHQGEPQMLSAHAVLISAAKYLEITPL